MDIKRKHEKFIRKHIKAKENSDNNCSHRLNVQYQSWLSWFNKRGYTVNSHISKREFAKLKEWFLENAEETRTSQVISLEFMIDSMLGSGLFSEKDVKRLFQLVGIDLAWPAPLDFVTVARILSPDNLVQLSIIREFISTLRYERQDDRTIRVHSEIEESFSIDNNFATPFSSDGDDTVSDFYTESGVDNGGLVSRSPSRERGYITRKNSDTVSAARKVRDKMKRVKKIAAGSVVDSTEDKGLSLLPRLS